MSVIEIVFPLLFIAVLGYGASRSGWFSREHIAGISKFAFYVCIPALLFSAMLKVPLKDSIRLPVLAAFYVPVVLSFALTLLLARQALKRSFRDCAVLALGGSYSNTLLVGLPVIMAAFGPAQMASVFLIIPFHSAVLFGLTFALAGNSAEGGSRAVQLIKGLLFNPVVASIGLGLIGNVAGLALPTAIGNSLEMLAKPAIASALFVLGANLNQYRLSSAFALTAVLSAIKLLLLPLLILIAGKLLGLTSLELAVTVLLGASPLGVNAYLIAAQLTRDSDIIAGAVVLSSMLCILTVIFWLTVLT
ncbi:AEC family transporter [Shewanella litorisediminis]|uniref:AEC family transporter n=1 Tax=Shewanella litorisediminis TaxID=1173586 RepID=A0ABX7G7A0_9GAMM|nr:AEC family transporter [Shewanella litorisediminis]MCL2916676.1 AEC family transporter [Shewanella litorisediminis]QRH03150.1 AEC family transporter [Shewanella litorisediminis]